MEDNLLTKDQKLSLTAAAFSTMLYCVGWFFVDMNDATVAGLNKVALLFGIEPMGYCLAFPQRIGIFFLWLVVGHFLIAEALQILRRRNHKKLKKQRRTSRRFIEY